MDRVPRGLFPDLKKQKEEQRRKRLETRSDTCRLRHPTNGKCLPLGEDCYECVSDALCKAVCAAYQRGVVAGIACLEGKEAEKT